MFCFLETFGGESRPIQTVVGREKGHPRSGLPAALEAWALDTVFTKGERRTSLRDLNQSFLLTSKNEWVVLHVFGLRVRIKIMNTYVLLRYTFAEILAISPFLRRVYFCTIWKMTVFSLPEKKMKCLHSRRTQNVCEIEVSWKIQDLWKLFCASQESMVSYAPHPPPQGCYGF